MSAKSSKSSPAKGAATVPFPVGAAGKRELKQKLRATTDPGKVIAEFAVQNSLHQMMAKAFGTVPLGKHRNTRNAGVPESLDTDSVVTFLSHLGVRQHEINKRISETLSRQLEEEIRKTSAAEPLLEMLPECWTYATTVEELRPVLWAVLKQLGPKTPLPMVKALTERDESGKKLKYEEIFDKIPPGLKRLCWEADWDDRVPLEKDVGDPKEYLQHTQKTLLFQTIDSFMTEYTTNQILVDSANRPFVATVSERKILTTQRRALRKSGVTTTTTTSAVQLTTGSDVWQIRRLLTDTAYRPKLLYATLSILMAQHGSAKRCFLGGASHLHCTLVADILLSAGGPLPKQYTDILTLARVLDESVQEGKLSDANLAKIQSALKLIFQSEQTAVGAPTPQKGALTIEPGVPTTAIKRQLNRWISAGLAEMKEKDPQQCFLNPVTDAIAPGYSKLIKKPMCIATMEHKVATHSYNSITDWEADVQLMFKNCIEYNKGASGKWFRDEAKRQNKVFRDEIFAHTRRLWQNEIIAKRTVLSKESTTKRKIGDGPIIEPLAPTTKKRKKENKEEYLPSMPALASMLLSDPFVVRIILDRILRELRRGVIQGTTIPMAHSVIPSLLQILHLTRWSTQLCAVRGKKFFIPSAGLDDGTENKESTSDPTTLVAKASLRRYMPLLARLLLEAEIDRRVAPGADLHEVMQQGYQDTVLPSIQEDEWNGNDQMQVAASLVEGALVSICQLGNQNHTSLAVTYPKFSTALERLSVSLSDDRPFFLCLIQALLRHKTKLTPSTRDAVVHAWLKWLQRKKSMISAAHECLILLLNEWSALGNVLLPRDVLIRMATQAVQTANESESKEKRKFANLWKTADETSDFALVKKQYERMLKHLPEASAKQWKIDVGLEEQEETQEEADKMDVEVEGEAVAE